MPKKKKTQKQIDKEKWIDTLIPLIQTRNKDLFQSMMIKRIKEIEIKLTDKQKKIIAFTEQHIDNRFKSIIAIISDFPEEVFEKNSNYRNIRLQKGEVIVPTFESPNAHNYDLDNPVMIAHNSGDECLTLKDSNGDNFLLEDREQMSVFNKCYKQPTVKQIKTLLNDLYDTHKRTVESIFNI